MKKEKNLLTEKFIIDEFLDNLNTYLTFSVSDFKVSNYLNKKEEVFNIKLVIKKYLIENFGFLLNEKDKNNINKKVLKNWIIDIEEFDNSIFIKELIDENTEDIINSYEFFKDYVSIFGDEYNSYTLIYIQEGQEKGYNIFYDKIKDKFLEFLEKIKENEFLVIPLK